jgi:SAM-dependent methyltransferase
VNLLALIFSNILCLEKVAQHRLLKRHAAALTGKLLDAGCGHKPYARLVPCREYIGMEVKPKNPEDVPGSVLGIPFPDATFDSALCLEVLEHIPAPAKGAAELFRVLKPGGHVYVTVPQMWYNHYEPYDYQRFTNFGLKLLLEQAGFEVLQMERTGGFWRFLFVRLTETTFRILRILLFPLAIHNRTRNAVCRFLCFPLNLLGLLLVPLLDCLSKRDHLGWVALARKPQTAAGKP